jgi:hypothetical protein
VSYNYSHICSRIRLTYYPARDIEFNIFEPLADPPATDNEFYPPATVRVHPNASPEVHAIPASRLEEMFYETRGHNGDLEALALYERLFDLCPRGQKFSIQIINEVS